MTCSTLLIDLCSCWNAAVAGDENDAAAAVDAVVDCGDAMMKDNRARIDGWDEAVVVDDGVVSGTRVGGDDDEAEGGEEG